MTLSPSFAWMLSLLSCGALMALSGCTGVKQVLGFEKNPPDEFSVVQRNPLTLPPDFSLRPPVNVDPTQESAKMREASKAVLTSPSSDASPDVSKTAQSGKQTILPGPTVPTSKGASRLLQKASSTLSESDQAAASKIRSQVDQEAGLHEEHTPGLAEKILFWQKTKRPGEKVIDPVAEITKIQQ